MRKVCVIYNIFDGAGNGMHKQPYYIDAFKSLILQDFNDMRMFKLCISGCLIDERLKNVLKNEFASFSQNYIDELYPVNVTFNCTVEKMREAFGDFECYVYVDSGINFWNLPHGIRYMYDTYKSGFFAMVNADPSNDRGYEWWGGEHIPQGAVAEIPIGRAMCGHVILYGHELLDTYGKLAPDAFACDTSESIHWCLAAGVGKKIALDKRVSVFHSHNMDGGNAFRKPDMPFFFHKKKTIEEICAEGNPYGFGWEECDPKRGLIHDSSQFDEHGKALNPGLVPFLKQNMFVQKDEFDISTIKSTWHYGI